MEASGRISIIFYVKANSHPGVMSDCTRDKEFTRRCRRWGFWPVLRFFFALRPLGRRVSGDFDRFPSRILRALKHSQLGVLEGPPCVPINFSIVWIEAQKIRF